MSKTTTVTIVGEVSDANTLIALRAAFGENFHGVTIKAMSLGDAMTDPQAICERLVNLPNAEPFRSQELREIIQQAEGALNFV